MSDEDRASGSNRFVIFMAALCGIRLYTSTLLAGAIVPDRYFAGNLWLGGRVTMTHSQATKSIPRWLREYSKSLI